MMKLLADENLNGRILRAILRAIPQLDVLRVQDTHLSGADDQSVLQWAAESDRVVLTHDVATMVGYAHERLRQHQKMPGVIAVRANKALGKSIEDLRVVILAAETEDIANQVWYLPF